MEKIKEIKNCDLIVKKFISDQKSLYNHNNKIDQNIEITNFSKYLPLKMEILIWIELIKRLSIRNLLYIPKFWWKRINCMKKKKFNKKKY